MKIFFRYRIYILAVYGCIFSFIGQSTGQDITGNEGDTLTLSQQYPGDEGMENDSNVLFIEKLEGTLAEIQARYSDVKNPQDMILEPDVPSGSLSQNSIKMTNHDGTTEGAHLFKNLASGFEGTIYLRYYVKYPLVSKGYFHHIGIRMGGYDPPTDYPIGQAGICNNQTFFNLAYEPVTDDGLMETYLYWPEMHSSNGECYGNYLIRDNGNAKTLVFDQWMCVEMMIKLNTPGEYDGEFRVWQDGEELGYWKLGYPEGRWYGSNFMSSSALPLYSFEGFKWRSADHPGLRINDIKFEFYDTESPATQHPNYVQYANIVVARKRIGPLVSPTGTSSIQHNLLKSEINSYPNPANSVLTIEGQQEWIGKANIVVYNAEGCKISETKDVELPHKLNISSFSPGIYMVKVLIGNKLCTQKFIKE